MLAPSLALFLSHPLVRAVARQLTNCHRQLQAIHFILERPRSVYVVRRGMINQRRVASRLAPLTLHPCPPVRSVVSIASTIGEHGRNVRCGRVSRPECWFARFYPLPPSRHGPKLFIAAGLMSFFCARGREKFRGPHAARQIRGHF